MGLVALQHLRWGDRMIAPGEEVPMGEIGRDYAEMLRIGQVEHIADAKPKAEPKKAAPKAKPKAEPKASEENPPAKSE